MVQHPDPTTVSGFLTIAWEVGLDGDPALAAEALVRHARKNPALVDDLDPADDVAEFGRPLQRP